MKKHYAIAVFILLSTLLFAQNNDGLTTSTAFNNFSQARAVTNSGIYYFDINNQQFSTYINNAGYVQIAIDFGNGNGSLPQVNTLTQTNRGILTPAILTSLIDIDFVRIKHSGNQFDVTTNNSSIIAKIQSNKTLHFGINDNAINNSWSGINSNKISSGATCISSHSNLLHQNIVHLCGNVNGLHWIPETNKQSIDYNDGEILDSESFSLWVLPKPAICNSNSMDSDNDGVCDLEDVCPNDDDSLIGLPCDDGNACTTNDIWQSNCECEGTKLADSDNDGTCDLMDICPNFNDDSINFS